MGILVRFWTVRSAAGRGFLLNLIGKSGRYKLENIGAGGRRCAAKIALRDGSFVKAKTTDV
jgi:hypothetical protein